MLDGLFSILIANYNNAATLLRAVESVRTQSYADWEIIIVDDGSTDHPDRIYRELGSDSRIHIYHNDQNRGCGYTKAACVAKAHGVYCGFLDPDDWLLPEALEKHVKVYDENPEVGIVYSRCHAVNEEGKAVGNNTLITLEDGETYFDYRELGAMNFCSFRKDAYDKTVGIDPSIRAAVDQDLYFKVEEVAKPYVLNEFTYMYVVGKIDGAITSKKNKANLYYWNLRVRQDACRRRGLNADEVLLPDFKAYFDTTYRIAYDDGAAMVHHSVPYRVGEFILRPIYWIKSLFAK